MKKSTLKRNVLSAIMCVSACYTLVLSASITPANAAPPALPSSINQIMNETGSGMRHDSDMLRYQQKKKEVSEDYDYYQRRKQGTDSTGTKSEVVQQNYGADDSSMRATVEEIDTRGVYVNSVQVAPSEILTESEIQSIIQKLVGKNVFINDIQDIIDEINNLYAKKGFVTARAFLPEQTVQQGNIYIDLIESKIGNITVQNNRWTRSGYITKRMPEEQNELFDIVELERNILDFNRYNEGVNLTANLKAGAQSGTTDIELIANENFPFHLVGVMDNAGRHTTGHIRGGAMLYADSLFGLRDRLSLGSYFSGGAQSPFADYNIPVNRHDGRVGFMFSSTLAQIKYGPLTDLDIKSRAFQYSLYYSQPIVRKPGFELKGYGGLNYKRARTLSDIAILNDWIGATDEVTSVDASLQMRKDTKYGIWYANQSLSYAIPILDSVSDYIKYSGGVVRLHDFSHGVIGHIRSNYQIIPGNRRVPYLDQIQSGGLATTRGYSEGIMIGKNGYFLSGELMFPLLPREITSPRSGEKIPFIGRYVKGAVFADHAGIFPTAREDIYDGSYFLMSLGMGLRIQLPGELSARLYWGYPLIKNAWQGENKMGRFHFELSLAPDVDALLRNRNTVVKVEEKNVDAQPYYNFDDVRHYDYFHDGGGGSL